MKMSKQMRDGLVLGLAVVVLVIVAVFTLKQTEPAPPPAPPPAQANTPAQDKAATKDTATGVWVETARLSGIVTEVNGGRNPFQNLYALPVAEPPQPAAKPPAVIPPPIDASVLPGMPMRTVQTVTLNWISWRELAARVADEFHVDVTPGKRPGEAKISGLDLDVAQAMAIVPTLDVEPEKPNFVLTGIITTSAKQFAVLTVDGKYYSLYEGDTIPALGWKVTNITSTGVTLQKGKQRVSLRLSGGKAL